MKRASTADEICWCTCGLLDLTKTGNVAPGELSQRQLTGRGLPGNKGVLDLLLAKRELMKVWVEKAKSWNLGRKS